MRVPFDTVFSKDPSGHLEPKQRIRVGGVEFGPGVKFGQGVVFGPFDFSKFPNSDLEVETRGDILVIKGIY